MTDEQVDALLRALTMEGFGLPYTARSWDYPDDADLQAADKRAHRDNRAALRAVAEVYPEEKPE
jgi:hypothetical protein